MIIFLASKYNNLSKVDYEVCKEQIVRRFYLRGIRSDLFCEKYDINVLDDQKIWNFNNVLHGYNTVYSFSYWFKS